VGEENNGTVGAGVEVEERKNNAQSTATENDSAMTERAHKARSFNRAIH